MATRDLIMHNGRLKAHRNGVTEILSASARIFREPGWEERPDGRTHVLPSWRDVDVGDMSSYEIARLEELEAAQAADNLLRAKRRAKTAVRDYALNTPMRYFLTLTFAPDKVDRYDVRVTVRRFGQWMSNQVKRRGIAYVAVAEHHKDGAIHFHALVTDGLEMVDSGTVIPPEGGRPRKPRSAAQRAAWTASGGHVVYNVPGWSYGFSTALELYGDYQAAVGYVTKYITKAEEKIGGRWYYSGGALGRPEVSFFDTDFDALREDRADARVFPASGMPGVQILSLTLGKAAAAAAQDQNSEPRSGEPPKPAPPPGPAASHRQEPPGGEGTREPKTARRAPDKNQGAGRPGPSGGRGTRRDQPKGPDVTAELTGKEVDESETVPDHA